MVSAPWCGLAVCGVFAVNRLGMLLFAVNVLLRLGMLGWMPPATGILGSVNVVVGRWLLLVDKSKLDTIGIAG
jgi:hypothetical protein